MLNQWIKLTFSNSFTERNKCRVIITVINNVNSEAWTVTNQASCYHHAITGRFDLDKALFSLHVHSGRILNKTCCARIELLLLRRRWSLTSRKLNGITKETECRAANKRKLVTLHISNMNASNRFTWYLSADEIQRIEKVSVGIRKCQINVINSQTKRAETSESN